MAMAENMKKRSPLVKRRGIRLTILLAAAILIGSLYLRARSDDGIPYPTGYRQWTHVKSALVGPKSQAFATSGGIHHLYANDKAMEGYRAGHFPDGSVIVADFLETQESESFAGITTEGSRRRVDVMIKDSKRYAETGGWGFESFKGSGQTDRMVAKEAATKCFTCHSSQKERDCVFSTYRQ